METAGAVEEQESVWREVNEQKERRLLHAGRRQKWIESGGALSDYSSEDASERGGRDPWDWGQDDDVN